MQYIRDKHILVRASENLFDTTFVVKATTWGNDGYRYITEFHGVWKDDEDKKERIIKEAIKLKDRYPDASLAVYLLSGDLVQIDLDYFGTCILLP